MGRLGWFLLFLIFFFPSSSNPFQHSLVTAFKEEDNVRNRGVVENGMNQRRFGKEVTLDKLQVSVHVHGVGGHGGRGHGGGGRGEGGGVMNHHDNNKENERNHRANNCSNNYLGFFHLALLGFAFTFSYLICI